MQNPLPHLRPARLLTAVLLLSLAGCASSGPVPQAASGLSRLEATGNPLCFTGPVCHAYPNFVDGQQVGMMRGSADVKAGERRLHLICRSVTSSSRLAAAATGKAVPALIPAQDAVSFQRLVYAKLEAGRVYRVQGEWDGERCTPIVVDAVTNQPIPLESVVVY